MDAGERGEVSVGGAEQRHQQQEEPVGAEWRADGGSECARPDVAEEEQWHEGNAEQCEREQQPMAGAWLQMKQTTECSRTERLLSAALH